MKKHKKQTSNKKTTKKTSQPKIKVYIGDAMAHADKNKDEIVYFKQSQVIRGLTKLSKDDKFMLTGDYGEDIVLSMLKSLTKHPGAGNIVFFKSFVEVDGNGNQYCSMFKKFKVTTIALAPMAWMLITDAIKNSA